MIKNEICLWDLCNKVYIKIKDRYREEFFAAVRKTTKNHKTIFKLLGNRSSNFSIYENGKSLISLDMVRKMLSVLNKRQKKIFMSQIENNLEFIKFGMRSSKTIIHPKFPIKFSANLARTVGHLVGDGGMQNKNSDYTVYYTNCSDVLIKQFKRGTLDVFGDVKSKLYIDKRDGVITIKFPSIVGHILTLFFGHQIRDLKHVPKIILGGTEEVKSSFLRSIYDDEGSVKKDSIALFMTNRKVIEDVKKLVKELNIKPGKTTILERGGNCKNMFGFSICSGGDLKLFHDKIGFEHPEKRNKLRFVIKGYKTFKRRRNEFRNTVIITLKQGGPMNIYELNNILQQKSINGLKKDLWSLAKKCFIKSKLVKNNGKKIKMYYVN